MIAVIVIQMMEVTQGPVWNGRPPLMMAGWPSSRINDQEQHKTAGPLPKPSDLRGCVSFGKDDQCQQQCGLLKEFAFVHKEFTSAKQAALSVLKAVAAKHGITSEVEVRDLFFGKSNTK